MWTPLISDRYFMMTMSSRDYQLFRLKTVDNYGNQVWQEMQYICKDDHFVGTPANTWIILTGWFDLSITKRYVWYTQVPLWPLWYQFEITIVNNWPSVSQSFVFIDDLLQSNLKREAGSYGSMWGDTTCIFPSPNTRENVQCNIGALQPWEHRYITLYANPLNNNGNYCTNIAYIITNDSNNSNNYSKVNFNCDSSVIQTGVVINNTWVIYGYGYGYQPWYGYGYGYGYMGGRYGSNKPYFYLTKPYLMISEKIYKKFKDVYTTRIKKLSKTALVRLFDKKTLRTMKRDVEVYLTKQIQSIASSKVLTVSQRLEQLRKFATYKWQAQVQYKELIDKK